MGQIYWDTGSLVLYLIEAFIGMLCLSNVCHANNGRSFHPKYRYSYMFFFILIWTFFAAFRHVGLGRGGSDAITYVDFFNRCWDVKDDHLQHVASDVLFLCINRAIRYFTSIYQIYFFIVYGFVSLTFIIFVKRFGNSFINTIPLFMAFYPYLRGYNTLRTLLCISFILLGIVALFDEKYRRAYLLMFCAILTHKIGIAYGLIIPFLHYSLNRRIKIKHMIAFAAIIIYIGLFFRDYFIQYAYTYDLGGAYGSYADYAKEANNWMAGSTEAFFQYLLAVLLLLFKKQIAAAVKSLPYQLHKSIMVLIYICYFDILLIPLNVLFGIWRGFEFFYLPRLLVWGLVINYLKKKMDSKSPLIINTVVFTIVVVWMIFRISRNYEPAALMPYSLDF